MKKKTTIEKTFKHEKPFEYLRKADGSAFDETIVRHWYEARAYVLNMLKKESVIPSKGSLHACVTSDTPLMLCIIRQIALSAHFLTYDEENGVAKNRTIISLVSDNSHIKDELEKEEYLCNLPKYCKFVTADGCISNEDSFVDVEIHIVSDQKTAGQDCIIIQEADVMQFCEDMETKNVDIYSINTIKAIYASRMYNLGTLISNLPAEDIHCTQRYSLALETFQHRELSKPLGLLSASIDLKNRASVKETISNMFCSDCFDVRVACIGNNNTLKSWADKNEVLSKSEHARWVVEKLIMGYRPLSEKERYKDERLSIQKELRSAYRKELKKRDMEPAHIDLCSYRDLRRVNPEDLKYDSFLMLAIPLIMKKAKEN